MKKLLIAFSLVLVVAIAGFSFVGCKKAETATDNGGSTQQQSGEQGQQGGEQGGQGQQGGEEAADPYVGTWETTGPSSFGVTFDSAAYEAVLTEYSLPADQMPTADQLYTSIFEGFSSMKIKMVITEDGVGYLWQVGSTFEYAYAKITYTKTANGDMSNVVVTIFTSEADVEEAYLACGYTQDEIDELPAYAFSNIVSEDSLESLGLESADIAITTAANNNVITATITKICQLSSLQELCDTKDNNSMISSIAAGMIEAGMDAETASGLAFQICLDVAGCISSATCALTFVDAE